jgi:hypothetical protein
VVTSAHQTVKDSTDCGEITFCPHRIAIRRRPRTGDGTEVVPALETAAGDALPRDPTPNKSWTVPGIGNRANPPMPKSDYCQELNPSFQSKSHQPDHRDRSKRVHSCACTQVAEVMRKDRPPNRSMTDQLFQTFGRKESLSDSLPCSGDVHDLLPTLSRMFGPQRSCRSRRDQEPPGHAALHTVRKGA